MADDELLPQSDQANVNPAIFMPGGRMPTLPAPDAAPDVTAPTSTASPIAPAPLPVLGPVLERNRWALTKPTGNYQPVPGYMQASTTPGTGQPNAMAPSLTKLGKLLTVIRAAGAGAIVGSTQPDFGHGFEAAQQNANQQAQTNLTQAQARQNLQYLPLMRAMQIQAQQSKINLQDAQADRAESAASRWGAPKQVGDRMMAFNPDTNQMQDVGPAGKPVVKQFGDRMLQYDSNSNGWKDVGAAPAKTKTPYGTIPVEIFGLLGDMPSTSTWEGKDYGSVRGAQQAWGREAQALKNSQAQARAQGYATTRGQVVTDTDTGITAPVSWAQLESAPPGKYISPQYDPNTRLAVKSWQDLAPSGKVGAQVTSYNTFLRHASNLYDAIDELKNSGYPDWNKSMNWLRSHRGDPRVQTFLAKLDPVQKEFQSFLLNNRALYSEDRETAKGMMSENSSPAQMYGVLQAMIHTGNARLAETNDTFKRATGADIPDLISPEGQAAIQKVGGPGAAAEMPPIVPRAGRLGAPKARGGSAPPATPSTPAAAPTPNTHVFNAKAWAAANPGKDVNAAIAQAKQQGYQVLQ